MIALEFAKCTKHFLPAISEFISKEPKISTKVEINLDRERSEFTLHYDNEIKRYQVLFRNETRIKIILVEKTSTQVQQTIPLEGHQPTDKLDTSNPPINEQPYLYIFDDKRVIGGFKEGIPNYSPSAKNGRYDTKGDVIYYKDGLIHREDGPAMICANGNTIWVQRGVPHRKDGPAAEFANGSKLWLVRGKLHCEDGPAIESVTEGCKYYLNDEEFTEQEYNNIMFEK